MQNFCMTPATNTVHLTTIGLEIDPSAFVEIRLQFRFMIEKPSASNNNVRFLQDPCVVLNA